MAKSYRRAEAFNSYLKEIETKRPNKDDWMFECKTCQRMFPSTRALNEHLSHRLFECPFQKCRQRFVHKQDLMVHERTCPRRLEASTFDCYKIYHKLDSPLLQPYDHSRYDNRRPHRQDPWSVDMEKYLRDELSRSHEVFGDH